MISFASLFVGLVFGIVNVELVAAAGVERVELLLDGRPVAELHEPWRTPLDLGCTPAPRELVAVAYGSGGARWGELASGSTGRDRWRRRASSWSGPWTEARPSPASPGEASPARRRVRSP